MSRCVKIIRNLLIITLIITILLIVFPQLVEAITVKTGVSNDALNNCIALSDIILSATFTICTYYEQKKEKEKCVYDFKIENDNLSLENYRRFPSQNEDTFMYVYKRKDDTISSPYYTMVVPFEKRYLCGVEIPLRMKVITHLVSEGVAFTNLRVYARNQKNVRKGKTVVQGTNIKKTIHEGEEFLIRIQLLCGRQLEKELLNSCIYLNFCLTLSDDNGNKHKRYFLIKIQNTMGESYILSIISKREFVMYMWEMFKLKYQLFCYEKQLYTGSICNIER